VRPTFTAATAALLLIAALPAAPSAHGEANRIVARVNDRIATLYDYESRFEEALRRERELPDAAAERDQLVNEIARDVMRDIFEELLVLSRADQLEVNVTANEVTESIDRMRKANGLEDEQQFVAALAQSGITPEVLRAQFEQQIRFQRVIGREVYSEVKLEEEDLRRYYKDNIEEFREPEQVKLRAVVVLDDTGASPAAAATAETLAATLRSGTPLEEAIAPLPAGTVSNVIELGWVESGDLDSSLEAAVWSLAAGAWSPPTRGRGGIHLAQVVERRESTIPAFKDVEAEIRNRQERAAVNERMEGYLEELEKKSYLYLDPPPRAAGFRGEDGEASSGVDFPFVAPGTFAEQAGKKAKGGKGARGDGGPTEAEAAGAEETEIERGLEELEDDAPPEDDDLPEIEPDDLPEREPEA
jgi:parvulin-like peptidyl-prolyl isomerase